ncbi:MAG TPA: alpha/beta hydrolase [Bacteroidia bacterium]|nr:alpha/beta hydrolase [Bacteroidia bacterium]
MNAEEIFIPIGDITLPALLDVPGKAGGVVIFSHGSGSSRLSTRNRFVAEILHRKNFATLLFDLLTEEEDRIYENRFDIDLLTQRLISVTRWIKKIPGTKDLRTGYFGASTGSASALKAASHLGNEIGAVVSRGGRPDLAGDIRGVTAPTLFIVGGLDTSVILLNREASAHLTCVHEMRIIEGASHLFEEKGKLSEVAKEAAEWYEKYLTA